eukprot:Pgem_evm2s4067
MWHKVKDYVASSVDSGVGSASQLYHQYNEPDTSTSTTDESTSTPSNASPSHSPSSSSRFTFSGIVDMVT